MTPEEKLISLGIQLPEAPSAVANYVPWVQTGNVVMTSGQIPWVNGEMAYTGKCGGDVSVEEGYEAAKVCAINAIAQLKAAVGNLSRISQILRIEGNVHSAPGFTGQPQVLNGASDLIFDIFGDKGRHTRTALGIFEMPLNAAVQISIFAEVDSE